MKLTVECRDRKGQGTCHTMTEYRWGSLPCRGAHRAWTLGLLPPCRWLVLGQLLLPLLWCRHDSRSRKWHHVYETPHKGLIYAMSLANIHFPPTSRGACCIENTFGVVLGEVLVTPSVYEEIYNSVLYTICQQWKRACFPFLPNSSVHITILQVN